MATALFVMAVLGPTGFITIPAQAQIDTTRINDASASPWNAVLHQSIRRRGIKGFWLTNPTYTSTGFAVAPHLILTSAHNLHSPFGSRVTRYSARIGLTGNQDQGSIELRSRRVIRNGTKVAQGFRFRFRPFRGFRFHRDFAYVGTDSTVAPFPHCFEPALPDTFVTVGDTVYIAGYPAHSTDGSHMYLSKGTITSIEGATFHYTNWTEKGFSGSPVWVLRNGVPKAIGIHAGSSGKHALAKKFDSDMLYFIARQSEFTRDRDRREPRPRPMRD